MQNYVVGRLQFSYDITTCILMFQLTFVLVFEYFVSYRFCSMIMSYQFNSRSAHENQGAVASLDKMTIVI